MTQTRDRGDATGATPAADIEYHAPTVPLTGEPYSDPRRWHESPLHERVFYAPEQGIHRGIDQYASGWMNQFGILPFDLYVTHSGRTNEEFAFHVCYERGVIHLDVSRYIDATTDLPHLFRTFTTTVIEALATSDPATYGSPAVAERVTEYVDRMDRPTEADR